MKIIALLLFIFFLTYPFPFTVASLSYSIQDLSKEQKDNLQIATLALNNFVLKPQQVFSFNRFFGERSLQKGYKAASSYVLGNGQSVGGGICLLASALYGLALKNNLKILERKSHFKIIHSVPAGLDSTIWFPDLDLKFQNIYFFPLQIKTKLQNNKLEVAFRARFITDKPSIVRKIQKLNTHQLQVKVYQNHKLISEDLYKI